MPRYFLNRHVFLCTNVDGAVLLDLRRDAYIGLGAEQANALSGMVHRWPHASAGNTSHAATESHAIPLAEKLVINGLLTRDESSENGSTPVSVEPVEARLVEVDGRTRPRVQPGHVVAFCTASFGAWLSLRCRPLHKTILAVQRRKARQRVTCMPPPDITRALVHIFLFLRPFFFSAKDRCLFDSLALVRFLASYGIDATLVIGVKTRPFAAHAWVQQGRLVLNGKAEYVRRYLPIFAA